MAKKLYEESYIEDIAVAIREKNGTETKYKTSEMGDAIRAINTDENVETCEVTINNNSSHLIYIMANSAMGVFGGELPFIVSSNSNTTIISAYNNYIYITSEGLEHLYNETSDGVNNVSSTTDSYYVFYINGHSTVGEITISNSSLGDADK